MPHEKSDIQKTTFSVNNGKYEFVRLTFAPSIFQSTLDDVLKEHIEKRYYVYVDPAIIFGNDANHHFNNLETVFCKFLKEEYIGFVVGAKGVKPNFNKIQTIADFPSRKTIKGLL